MSICLAHVASTIIVLIVNLAISPNVFWAPLICWTILIVSIIVATLLGRLSAETETFCSRYLDKVASFVFLKHLSAVVRDHGIGPREWLNTSFRSSYRDWTAIVIIENKFSAFRIISFPVEFFIFYVFLLEWFQLQIGNSEKKSLINKLLVCWFSFLCSITHVISSFIRWYGFCWMQHNVSDVNWIGFFQVSFNIFKSSLTFLLFRVILLLSYQDA